MTVLRVFKLWLAKALYVLIEPQELIGKNTKFLICSLACLIVISSFIGLVLTDRQFFFFFMIFPFFVWLLFVMCQLMVYFLVYIRWRFTDFGIYEDTEGWDLISKTVPLYKVIPDLENLDAFDYLMKYDLFHYEAIDKILAATRNAIGHSMIRIDGRQGNRKVYYLFEDDLEVLSQNNLVRKE